MVQLLFLDAALAVVVNSKFSKSFAIQRGMHQGCALAPYLFLLVAQTLNDAAKAATEAGAFQGILLSIRGSRLLMLQFAVNTAFTIEGQESHLQNLVKLLRTYGLAIGLYIN